MRYSLVCFCCVFLMACKQETVVPVSESAASKTAQQRTAKPGADVQLQHRVTKQVALAQPVTIEMDISSTSPAAEVNVRLKLDDNLSLVSDQSEWQLTLDADNNPTTLAVEVVMRSGVEGYIHVFVVESSAAGDRTRSFAVPVRLPEAERSAAEKAQQKQPSSIEMPAEENIY